MEAIELLNIIRPEHDRTSCSDENIFNGFHTATGFHPRCRRCALLQIINRDEDVPKDVDLSEVLY